MPSQQRRLTVPTSAPTRCLKCKRLVRGQCPTCNRSWAQRPKSWPKGGNDPRWREVRRQRLDLDPLCSLCGLVATTVDHLDGTDYQDDSYQGASWLNLDMTRSLCTPCHRSRTGRQGGAASRA